MTGWMTVLEENHTDYAACYQRIKWNTEVIAGYERPNGFVVQHFSRTSAPKDFIHEDTSYYEAWEVRNGSCIDTEGRDYDDEFAIGYPWDQLEVFHESMYTIGEYCFRGEVFWVDKEKHSLLFQIVSKWPRDEVEQAGGLCSVFQAAEFANKKPNYMRIPFVHKWDMSHDEYVYTAAKKALFRLCPNPDNKRDQEIFAWRLKELFLDTQGDMKEKLWEEWKEKNRE